MENLSDDTIGNAIFSRLLFTDLHPEWKKIEIVTSDFHMERTKAIFQWAYSLEKLDESWWSSWARRALPVELSFRQTSSGSLTHSERQQRSEREAQNLASFRTGPAQITDLRGAHEFLFKRHSAYSTAGALIKRPKLTPELEQTY